MRTLLAAVLVTLLMLAGCVAPETVAGISEETALESTVPERLSFVAPTLDRDVDNGSVHDLRSSTTALS